MEDLVPMATDLDLEAIDVAVGAPRLDIVRLLAAALEQYPQVSLRILCAAPGDAIVAPSAVSQGLTLAHDLSMELAEAWKQRLLEVFTRDVDGVEKTNTSQEAVIKLATLLREGRIQFGFFDRRLNFTRTLLLHTKTGPLSLAAHGGFHPAALSEAMELRTLQFGEAAQQVEAWFERMWADSRDLSAEVTQLVMDSWACQLLSPTDAYHKVLIEYFSEMLESGDPFVDNNSMLEYLAVFQKHAYAHAKGILRRFGGVFISDVVGLGKTFIGLALLKHTVEIQQARPLIIAPPRLCGMWDELTLKYGIEKEILSSHQLEKLDGYQSRDLLLIDESHAFRNKNTQRYEMLMNFLRPNGEPSRRKVILLSATPQNNTCWDVYNQLQFFPDVYGQLPYDGEDLKEFFQRVDRGEADLASLMQYVLVRRTRAFIQQEYPDATLPGVDADGNATTQPIVFPERRDGEKMALRYSIEAAYDGLYDDIIETLRTMTYARYGLSAYLRDEARGAEEYKNMMRVGNSLRGLFKAILLKRCESSLAAFKGTLRRLISTHDAFYSGLMTQDRVLAKPAHVGARADAMDVEDIIELFQVSYPASDFDRERLAADITADWKKLMRLREKIDRIPLTHDAKFQRLRTHLEAHPPTRHRTLVFTQFTDTARYLYDQLRHLDMRVELITSDDGNQADIVRRFAPRATEAEVEPAEQIDLLISTDVLSEGVNLQDADTIINYDLHWNPVRLIQRAGRIDRIGSQNKEIFLYNFLPETAIEEALGLERVLRRRIREIQQVFGEDGQILSAEQQLEDARLIDVYTGKALRDAEEDQSLDHLSHHLTEAFHIKQKRPRDYKRLSEMRPGQRAMLDSSGQISVVMGQAGWYKRFYTVQDAARPRILLDEQALGLLRDWAQCSEWVKSATINAQLNHATYRVEQDFAQEVRRLREKRDQPRLTPAQSFIREQLVALHRRLTGEKERGEVNRMIAWIERGSYKILFDEHARRWQRNKLSAEAIRGELRSWLRQYPEREEALPEPQIVVSMLGG
ncbi:DEAD/DEAH box helicase [Bradymonas sediminis]|nr:DEAD/DEAH box helicase [Bradymonas sediminis]